MNNQRHAESHLNKKSLDAHQQEFGNSNIIYLSIFYNLNNLAGYIILAKESNISSVQLRRVLIDKNYLGIGQDAIINMENYCITQLKIDRIWLDVFKDNSKAIHIYEKLGYKPFKQNEENNRVVLFYEKYL